MIYQKDKVRYGTTTIPYQIIKTGRVKTSEVIVDADTTTITVRTPLEKNKNEIQRIVLDKASWILQKQREFKENKPQLTKPTFKQNSTLPYLGRNYRLAKIRKNNNKSKNELQFINDEFVATIKSSSRNSSKTLIKNLYERWLLDNAQIILREKAEYFSKITGIAIERINIKNVRKRWGSLSKGKKTINLNVNLLKAPDDVIDYIILHELCHMKINDHSHHYWDLVRKYMPNYQEKIDWLNVNTSILV
jgi:predicted metal-dependent hydrolase